MHERDYRICMCVRLRAVSVRTALIACGNKTRALLRGSPFL
jgi:hypothetical protein